MNSFSWWLISERILECYYYIHIAALQKPIKISTTFVYSFSKVLLVEECLYFVRRNRFVDSTIFLSDRERSQSKKQIYYSTYSGRGKTKQTKLMKIAHENCLWKKRKTKCLKEGMKKTKSTVFFSHNSNLRRKFGTEEQVPGSSLLRVTCWSWYFAIFHPDFRWIKLTI